MSRSVKALIIVTLGIAQMAVSAEARLFPTWETHITLTHQDLDMIRNTVTSEIHGKPVGTQGFMAAGRNLENRISRPGEITVQ